MMVPNDVVNRIGKILFTLDREPPSEQLTLARKHLSEGAFWITKERDRRVEQKKRDIAERLAAQEESNQT